MLFRSVLHFGDHNLIAKAHHYEDEDKFSDMCRRIKGAFAKSDVSEVIRLMDEYFGRYSYTLWHLFKDEQRRILNQILESTLEKIEASFRHIYNYYYPIINALSEKKIPLPKALATNMEFILNTDLKNLLEEENLDFSRLQKIIEEVKRWSFEPDKKILGFVVSEKINTLMKKLSAHPQDIELLKTLNAQLNVLNLLSLDLDLWKAQNIYFNLGKQLYAGMLIKAKDGDERAREWIEYFGKLSMCLKVKVI